jgi:hypothetical protein
MKKLLLPAVVFGETFRTILPMRLRLFLPLVAVLLGGCIHVKLDPVQVHATVDVNVRVDRALDDFFGDLDQTSATIGTSSN